MDDLFDEGERAASPIFNFEAGSYSQSNVYSPVESTQPSSESTSMQYLYQQQSSASSHTKGLQSSPESITPESVVPESVAPESVAPESHFQVQQVFHNDAQQSASEPNISTTNNAKLDPSAAKMEFLKAKMAKRHGDANRGKNTDSRKLPFNSNSATATTKQIEDEHAWMYDDSDDQTSAKLVDLMAKKNSIDAQNQRSQLTAEKAAELIRLNEEIAKLERQNRELHEENMFITEDEGENSEFSSCGKAKFLEDIEDHDEEMEAATRSVDDDDEAAQIPKPDPAKKSRRKAPMNAREVNQRRKEETRKKKQKQDQKNAEKSKKQLQKKGLTKKRKASHTGKGRKGKKQKNNSLMVGKSRMKNSCDNGDPLREILDNLRSNNPIDDRANQADYGPAPQIESRNKETQLALILGSVPSDYDTHKAKTEKKELLQASKRFGRGQVKAHDGMWLMKGMQTTLYHHQLLGVDWMVNRELSESGPKGGIVADSMGLGKTVELLATMVMNPPTTELIQKKIKSTLIIVPASLIHQWRTEIERHADNRRISKVQVFKSACATELPLLKECDVVLTTYAEIMRSYPFPSPEEQKEMSGVALEKWIRKHANEKGNLHKMKWYRVVLDEAHQIKNYKSRTSLACLDLDSEYRWALSGTPLQNKITELYPYFRFLRSNMTTSMTEFQKYYQNDGEDSYIRINVALSVVMIRRTIKDKLFGRPIIELPNTHPTTEFIEFSKEEAALYRIVECRFREILNHHLVEGTAERNYSVFMVQLLRLRQATAHPFLLEHLIKSLFTAEDLLSLQSQIKTLKQNSTPIYEQIKQWVKSPSNDSADQAMENAPFGISNFGKHFNMGPYLERLGDDSYTDRVCCRLCGDFVKSARKIDCGHIFCGECIVNYIHHEAQKGVEIYTCPQCSRTFRNAEPFNFGNPIDDEEQSDNDSLSFQTSKGRDYNDIEPRTLESNWLDLYDKDPSNYELVPSAKSIAIKSILCHWLDSDPKDKIIIFVQWKLMARVLGRMLNAEKHGFVYYTGDMNNKARVEATRVFHENPKVKIMIAGLKCGGQGLNLTCANRVISVDLWWNHSVEQQAFGRVFRIGQKKDTHLKRMVIRNTVDARLLDMQADKVKLCDRAMQDTGESIEPLSIKDLANLFGFVREDTNGIMQVYPDYQDGPETPDYQA